MGDAVGQILALAVGVAVNPLAIVPVVMIVATPRARVNGPAFAAGWILGLLLVGEIVLAFAPEGSDDTPPGWARVLKLVLGLVLVGLAAVMWRQHAREGAEPKTPSWVSLIDRLSAVRAFGMAFLVATVNPKNLVLSVAAAGSIAQTDATAREQAVAYLVFVLIGSLGVLLPVAAALLLGERAAPALARLQCFMTANSKLILALILLLLGAKLVGDAVGGY